MGCYMALLMQLADKPEVLRISLIRKSEQLNYGASAVIQSATKTERPLLDAGLDGQGEVIQVGVLRRDRCVVGKRVGCTSVYFVTPASTTTGWKHSLMIGRSLSPWPPVAVSTRPVTLPQLRVLRAEDRMVCCGLGVLYLVGF